MREDLEVFISVFGFFVVLLMALWIGAFVFRIFINYI